MSKLTRTERLIAMVKTLVERPGEQIPLAYFMDQYDSAKSTISEDLALIKETLEARGSGLLRTQAGAVGGVQYWPLPSESEVAETLSELCRLLGNPARILPGGFVYMTDVLTTPVWVTRIGQILARRFYEARPEAVLTVETKGIPLALMVARALGIPMVMARREGRVTEGPSFSVHYLSSSMRRINTMTVGTRALKRDARVLVVDDFMKAGATARGLVDLVTELGATVVGIGILVTTAEPQKKRVEQYSTLLTLVDVNEEERTVLIRPAFTDPKGE